MLDSEGSKLRRAGHRKDSAALLRGRGVQFESKNDGAHLIVTQGDTTVDFWPGTGLWIDRKSGTRRRGVFKLITFLRQQG